jgi:uncharacterized Tic20 family protein
MAASSTTRRLFSLLCHGSIFLSSIVFPALLPLAIYLTASDEVIKESAREVLNFHLNIWVYGALTAGLIVFLTALIITIPLAWVVGIAFYLFHWVPPVFALLATLKNPDQPYRYPFIWRIL